MSGNAKQRHKARRALVRHVDPTMFDINRDDAELRSYLDAWEAARKKLLGAAGIPASLLGLA